MDNNKLTSLKEDLEKIIEDLELSQEKLAHALGISFATLNRIKNGRTKINNKELQHKIIKLKELISKTEPDKLKDLGKAIDDHGLTKILEAAIAKGLVNPSSAALNSLIWLGLFPIGFSAAVAGSAALAGVVNLMSNSGSNELKNKKTTASKKKKLPSK